MNYCVCLLECVTFTLDLQDTQNNAVTLRDPWENSLAVYFNDTTVF